MFKIIKEKDLNYVKESFALVRIVVVDLVLPHVERLLFDELQVVHLIEQMWQEILGKALGLGEHLQGVDGLDLFALIFIRAQVLVQQVPELLYELFLFVHF